RRPPQRPVAGPIAAQLVRPPSGWPRRRNGVPLRRRMCSRINVMKGQAISVRLSEPVELLVREEAERSGRSRSQVVEELADEAARLRLYPGIGFRGPEPRRAYVLGSGLDVWQIVELLEEYGDELAALTADHPL